MSAAAKQRTRRSKRRLVVGRDGQRRRGEADQRPGQHRDRWWSSEIADDLTQAEIAAAATPSHPAIRHLVRPTSAPVPSPSRIDTANADGCLCARYQLRVRPMSFRNVVVTSEWCHRAQRGRNNRVFGVSASVPRRQCENVGTAGPSRCPALTSHFCVATNAADPATIRSRTFEQFQQLSGALHRSSIFAA